MNGSSASSEEVLAGGNMTAVVKVGATVRRTAGPWSPTVHRLLRHLRAAGLRGVPEPLGLDDQGRELLGYLPGTVPSYPLPDWIWAEQVLAAAADRLAEIHAASAGFDRTGAVWQLPSHAPAEVICHNDFAPYNLVFDREHRLTGVIDWDTASPGPRVWDLAYLAYRLVPLTAETNPDTPNVTMAERRRRLDVLMAAYATPVSRAKITAVAAERVADLADFTAARADPANDHLHEHVSIYRADLAWLAAHDAELA